jgi:hypothetical protein
MSRRQAHFEWEADIFSGVLREGKRTGRLHVFDPSLASLSLIHATNSFLPYNLTPRELGKRKELEEQVSRLADLLLQGLLLRPKR